MMMMKHIRTRNDVFVVVSCDDDYDDDDDDVCVGWLSCVCVFVVCLNQNENNKKFNTHKPNKKKKNNFLGRC